RAMDHRRCVTLMLQLTRTIIRIIQSLSCNALLLFFSTHPSPARTYTLSLHDALPISASRRSGRTSRATPRPSRCSTPASSGSGRSEEHTSELQSPYDLVCRLLLEKKKKKNKNNPKNSVTNKDYKNNNITKK